SMRPPSSPADPGFDVVVLGAGLNSLNLTIAFHQQYGMRCTTVVRVPVAMNQHTVTSDQLVLGADATDEQMRDALLELAARRPAGRPALLLTNADSLIEFIDRFREELEEHYLLAQVDGALLSRLADKAEFAQICEQLGIGTVPTVIVDFSRAEESDWDGEQELPWSYPVVGKAANTAEYHHVDFPGKRKVFFLESREEHLDLVRRLRGRGALPGRRGLRGLRELRREGRPAHRRRVLLRDQPAHRPQQLLRDRGRGERGPPRRRRPRPRPGHRPGRRHGRDPLLDPAGLPGAALPARSRAAHADPAPGAHRAAQPLPVPSGRPVDAGLLRRLRPELRAQVPRRLPPPHRHRLL